MNPPPLDGIRIIAVEQYGAGPFGSSYLADMGAEVVKVETPGLGDSSRQSGPYFLGENDSHFFQTFNRSKLSLTLDLKSVGGRQVFRKLVATADAVMNNLRGDQPVRLCLTYDDLKEVNRRIVCVHLSGYGRSGTRASWPGYDYLMQAEAGFMELTGEPGGPPSRMGLSIVDYLSGITAAFALTSALLGALKIGRGRDVDVSLYDVAMHQLSYPAAWHLNEGADVRRRPRSGHPSVVPCEVFPTADGHVFVMCVLQKFWEALCRGLECPELIDDPRFLANSDRYSHRDELAELLDAAFRTGTTEVWLQRLSRKVPIAPILGLGDALRNPHAAASDNIETVSHPDTADGLSFVASPIRLDGKRPTSRAAPKLGADTDRILKELGYTEFEIRQLRETGAV